MDGDTVRVRLHGEEETVRLLGVDAPETGHPSRPEEYYGAEATRILSSLCAGKRVLLEHDREDTDRYGRLLRYLFLPPPDGRSVNLELVRRGAARVLTRFPFSRKEEFLQAQEQARREGAGIWRDRGMAEIRWLVANRPEPVRVYRAGGGRYAVVLDGWGAPSVRSRDVGRLAGRIGRLRREYSDAEFPGQARKAGFLPLSAPATRPEKETGSSPEAVSFESAGRRVGQRVVVEGRIVRTHRSRNGLFLQFHPNWKRYLSIRIPPGRLGDFPASPEQVYRGRRVRVTGTVILDNDAPQIVVRSQKEITPLP
ncbi:MAG: hypothetical protein Kow00128_14280 [Deltaproteobacteria bacterium]